MSKNFPGRKPIIDLITKRHYVREMTKGELLHATQATKFIQTEFKVDVSERTVRRTLNAAGLKAVEKVAKPDLSVKNREERYWFALAHKDWTIADWERVIWSDETKINRFCLDGLSWCWYGDNEELK